jgi:hypothetical protein
LSDCFLWDVFLIAKVGLSFGLFFRSKSFALTLTQNGLGNILGDFSPQSHLVTLHAKP